MERLHTSVGTGKKLAKSFYGKSHDKSYYLGCSLGGRQGIKAAEKFPDDFDGIIAGAPALDFNNLASWRANFFRITGAIGSSDFISTSTWKSLIHNEILKQCDGIDGIIDGIIEDPNLCDFHPETLLCKDTNGGADCLTPIQVEEVRKIFSPLYSDDGGLIFPAMQPGSEIMAVDKLYAGKPFSYSEVPSFTCRSFSFSAISSSFSPFCFSTNHSGSTGLVQIRHLLQPPLGRLHLHHPRCHSSGRPQPR
jgi:feruloyl esterase